MQSNLNDVCSGTLFIYSTATVVVSESKQSGHPKYPSPSARTFSVKKLLVGVMWARTWLVRMCIKRANWLISFYVTKRKAPVVWHDSLLMSCNHGGLFWQQSGARLLFVSVYLAGFSFSYYLICTDVYETKTGINATDNCYSVPKYDGLPIQCYESKYTWVLKRNPFFLLYWLK